ARKPLKTSEPGPPRPPHGGHGRSESQPCRYQKVNVVQVTLNRWYQIHPVVAVLEPTAEEQNRRSERHLAGQVRLHEHAVPDTLRALITAEQGILRQQIDVCRAPPAANEPADAHVPAVLQSSQTRPPHPPIAAEGEVEVRPHQVADRRPA